MNRWTTSSRFLTRSMRVESSEKRPIRDRERSWVVAEVRNNEAIYNFVSACWRTNKVNRRELEAKCERFLHKYKRLKASRAFKLTRPPFPRLVNMGLDFSSFTKMQVLSVVVQYTARLCLLRWSISFRNYLFALVCHLFGFNHVMFFDFKLLSQY